MSEQLLPDRKHPLHGVEEKENQPTIVFLTVCTKNRIKWLANPTVHELLQKVWKESNAWSVGRYVVMPDHIHMFVSPTQNEISLESWVQYWKSQFSKQIKRMKFDDIINRRWQSHHWDTRLRNWQSYDEKWWYVRNNPIRHGLIQDSAAWPFQGEIFELRWD